MTDNAAKQEREVGHLELIRNRLDNQLPRLEDCWSRLTRWLERTDGSENSAPPQLDEAKIEREPGMIQGLRDRQDALEDLITRLSAVATRIETI
jgi:hypothetical protein